MVNNHVHAALARLQTLLTRRGAVVRFVYLRPGPHGEKVGLDDFIAARLKTGVTPELIRKELFELAEDKLRRIATATDDAPKIDGEGRPEINISGKQLRQKVGEALDAMQGRNQPPALFARDGSMARLRDGRGELEEVDTRMLLAELAEAANWVRSMGKTRPPQSTRRPTLPRLF
jgi:hypothetical protein